MAFGTQTQKEMFRTGERLRECRKWRGLSREQLAEKVDQLSNDGEKLISTKQIGYIESGARQLSAKYLFLISKALHIRKEYLTLEDDFRTEIERLGARSTTRNEKHDLLEQLMKLHGVEVEIRNASTNTAVTEGKPWKIQPVTVALISPGGSTSLFTTSEYWELLENMDDYIEYLCAKQFKKENGGYIEEV